MLQPRAILQELQKLLEKDRIPFTEADAFIASDAYPPLAQYLHMLIHQVKPETATAELFKALAADVLRLEMLPEVAVKGGFIDFAIHQKETNPILLELKPAFKIVRSKQTIAPESLHYEYHKTQIQKYLLSNEYVILTNLRTIFVFSREALIDYQPFYQNDVVTFLHDYLAYDNLWDYIRRTEDRIPCRELDQAFFDDLKKWYAQLQTLTIHPKHGFTKDELIVLFLNKMVFIKTLEDYGLIPFKFLEDTYADKRSRWYVKGEQRVFERFFDEIEQWCYQFYDTELFKTAFWDFVAVDSANLKRFRQAFENVMGFGAWQQSFGKGLIHYNYRLIDEDVFGKAYETFLAEHRKDTGIYYTPQPITQYMAEQLVSRLFDPGTEAVVQAVRADDYPAAHAELDQLQEIKVLDPCSGSGSFLIKVLREIYARYSRIRQEVDRKAAAARREIRVDDIFSEQPQHVKALGRFIKTYGFDDPRRLIAAIILHHIYAVDIDERALDTAKTNIWKEAVKLEPRAFNFTRLPEDRNHILPSLELNFINADSLADLPVEQAIAIITEEFKDAVKTLHALRDAYLQNPFDPTGMAEMQAVKQPVLDRLRQELPELPNPVCMPLSGFFVYFDRNGAPLPAAQRGFHGLISNPPWEEIYPVKKEFAEVGKYSIERQHFDKMFNKRLKEDNEFRARWEEYKNSYKTYTQFVMDRYEFHSMKPAGSRAMRTHLNYFKVFVERDLEIIKEKGIINILIPSSFQTDEGGYGLRNLIVDKYRLLEIYSFENRGYKKLVDGKEVQVKHFPDVHPQFKFSIVSVQKEQAADKEVTFNAKFYLHNPAELHAKPISYSTKMVKNFSPENLSIMEFRTDKDYALCSKIKGDHSILKDIGVRFRREFNMTDDSKMFQKSKTKDNLVMYEGKMIHQFNPNFSSQRFYVDEKEGREQLLRKETNRIKKELKVKATAFEKEFESGYFKLDYETYRFVYRAVASSTNERSLIGSIIPPEVFTGHSLNYLINCSYEARDGEIIQKQVEPEQLMYILALFNSLTLNYYIRNKISANLTMNFIYELPIPAAAEAQRAAVIQRAFSLLARRDSAGAFDELSDRLGLTPDLHTDPIQLRAALEVLIARDLYGLTAGEWTYLTSTFVYGSPTSATRQELDAIIRASRELFA
jgi:hypothetical protein